MSNSGSKSMLRKRKPKGSVRGPKPDTLKLDYDWKDAVKKSLEKKKPPEGWPQKED